MTGVMRHGGRSRWAITHDTSDRGVEHPATFGKIEQYSTDNEYWGSGMGFSGRITRHGDMPVLQITGAVGLESEDELESLIMTRFGQDGSNLILDLAEVTYIDSWTLGLFVRVEHLLSARGGALAIASPQPDVARLFALTGLLRRLHVFDSLDEAVTYLGGPQAQ